MTDVLYGIGYGARKHIVGSGPDQSSRATRAICSDIVVLEFLANDPQVPVRERERLERARLCGTCAKRMGLPKCQRCGGSGLEP